MCIRDRIKQSNRTRHIPVILESFEFSGENRIRALQCGADAMFQKPINLQELFLQLNNLLRTKDVLRDYYRAAGSAGVPTGEMNSTDERFILSVTNYVYGHLDDPNLSVNDLAQHVNVSRTQLYLNMKRLFDQTPSVFILQIKMREAAKLLQTTDKTCLLYTSSGSCGRSASGRARRFPECAPLRSARRRAP